MEGRESISRWNLPLSFPILSLRWRLGKSYCDGTMLLSKIENVSIGFLNLVWFLHLVTRAALGSLREMQRGSILETMSDTFITCSRCFSPTTMQLKTTWKGG